MNENTRVVGNGNGVYAHMSHYQSTIAVEAGSIMCASVGILSLSNDKQL